MDECSSSNKKNKGKVTRANEQEEGEEEDRISSLSDDLIHRVLSFVDAESAVQTCVLSTRWKNVWSSLPHLNFQSSCFRSISEADFRRFVGHFLSRRNNDSEIYRISCTTTSGELALVKGLVSYAISHNAHQLDIATGEFSLLSRSRCGEFSLSNFNSPFLKHLNLKVPFRVVYNSPESIWNLPTLTTLHLEDVRFGITFDHSTSSETVDLFSKLVNLRDITLTNCTCSTLLKVFNIFSPGLQNLTILNFNRWRNEYCNCVVSAPYLKSFSYKGCRPLLLLTNHLRCLDKVYIDIGAQGYSDVEKQIVARGTVDIFYQLRTTMFLTLSLDTLEVLSAVPELLESRPSPFSVLKYLKLEKPQYFFTSAPSSDAIAYFMNNSPTVTVINEFHEGTGGK